MDIDQAASTGVVCSRSTLFVQEASKTFQLKTTSDDVLLSCG